MNHTSIVAILCAAALLAPALSHGQADTAAARQLFSDINKRLPQLDQVSFISKRPGVSYKAEGRAWSDAGTIVKIEIIERDDSGDVVSEFYFSNSTLVFVYEAIKGFADSGNTNKQITKLEERYYFRDGKLFKWISGMAKDQSDNPVGNADFADAGKSRLAAANTFIAAARKAHLAKNAPK
jgi:hypothetical protein